LIKRTAAGLEWMNDQKEQFKNMKTKVVGLGSEEQFARAMISTSSGAESDFPSAAFFQEARH
jgi:hypothetical protein